MSMYHVIHGRQPGVEAILDALGLDPGDVPRLRDCWVEPNARDGGYRIVIYTRMGGGNRDEYQEDIDALADHPLYLSDHDVAHDPTYAAIHFALPEAYAGELRALALDKPRDMEAEFQAVLERIRNGGSR